MVIHISDKYTDMTNDNKWLHRIANEVAKNNALLEKLIELQGKSIASSKGAL